MGTTMMAVTCDFNVLEGDLPESALKRLIYVVNGTESFNKERLTDFLLKVVDLCEKDRAEISLLKSEKENLQTEVNELNQEFNQLSPLEKGQWIKCRNEYGLILSVDGGFVKCLFLDGDGFPVTKRLGKKSCIRTKEANVDESVMEKIKKILEVTA